MPTVLKIGVVLFLVGVCATNFNIGQKVCTGPRIVPFHMCSKTSVKQPLSKRQKIGFQDQLSLNAGQKSAILSSFIKLPFVIKIFVLSVFEWLFYTGFTVYTPCGKGFSTRPQYITLCPSPLTYFQKSINNGHINIARM